MVSVGPVLSRSSDNKTGWLDLGSRVAAAGAPRCSAWRTSGSGSTSLDLRPVDVFESVAASFEIDGSTSSIVGSIGSAAFEGGTNTSILGSEAVCCGPLIPDPRDLVSLVVTAAGVSTSGAAVISAALVIVDGPT